MQTILIDPSIAAYSSILSKRSINSYYAYIVPEMVQRYKDFRERAERKIKEIEENKEQKDTEGKQISDKTLFSVHSFILNDFGNASVNYFSRFGDENKLDDAINGYKTAKQKDPDNAIIYYNLSYAYRLKDDQEDKITKCIDKCEKLSPSWPDVIITSAQTHIRQKQKLIDEIEEKRNIEENRKKELNEKLEEEGTKLSEKIEISKKIYEALHINYSLDVSKKYKSTEPVSISDLLMNPGNKDFSNPLSYAVEIEGKNSKLPSRFSNYLERRGDYQIINSIQAKIDESTRKINEMDKEIKDLQDELRNEKFPKIKTIMDHHAKLSSLFEGLKIDYDGGGVNKLCTFTIERERLDVNDIEVLKVWAEFLSYNHKNEDALVASTNLCHLIQNFYPESIDINMILYRIYENQNDNEDKETNSKNIKTFITDWLISDPINYYALNSVEAFPDLFNSDELIRFLKEAIEIDKSNDTHFNKLGDAYYSSEDYHSAIENYKEALRITPKIAVYHSNLAGAYRKLKEWDKAVKEFNKAISIDPEKEEYQNKLKWTLDEEENHYFNKYLHGSDMISVVLPIAIEVASNLIPYISKKDEELNPDFSNLLVKMRDDVYKSMGVKVPGVRIRGNEGDLPFNTYIFKINEIPLVMGSLKEKQLFIGHEETLIQSGITGEETTDPETGDKAFWVSQNEGEKLQGQTLLGVTDYIVRHLKGFIGNNLLEFIDHQKVMSLLKSKLPDAYEKLRKNREDLSLLVTILKSLLNEDTPITAIDKIVEEFDLLKNDTKDIATIVEEIRLIPKIRSELSGNNDNYSFYKLGNLFEKMIFNSIRQEEKQSFLALDPESAQEALREVREMIGSQRNIAIVVECARIRPFFRQLSEIEFPLIPVLSRKELLPDLENKIIGEIELDQKEVPDKKES